MIFGMNSPHLFLVLRYYTVSFFLVCSFLWWRISGGGGGDGVGMGIGMGVSFPARLPAVKMVKVCSIFGLNSRFDCVTMSRF